MVLLQALVDELAELVGLVVDGRVEDLLLDGRVDLELLDDLAGELGGLGRRGRASSASLNRANSPRTRLWSAVNRSSASMGTP